MKKISILSALILASLAGSASAAEYISAAVGDGDYSIRGGTQIISNQIGSISFEAGLARAGGAGFGLPNRIQGGVAGRLMSFVTSDWTGNFWAGNALVVVGPQFQKISGAALFTTARYEVGYEIWRSNRQFEFTGASIRLIQPSDSRSMIEFGITQTF